MTEHETGWIGCQQVVHWAHDTIQLLGFTQADIPMGPTHYTLKTKHMGNSFPYGIIIEDHKLKCMSINFMFHKY